MKQYILSLEEDSLNRAATLLKNNHLVAIPTETVYGLAALSTSSVAVAKIYALKTRPQFNPLICHVSSLYEAMTYGVFSSKAQALAKAFWPGPLTLVVPLKEPSPLSDLATAGLKTIGLRVPMNDFVLKLIEKVGYPLAAPSANPSEHISPTTAEHVYKAFKNKSPLILDGGPSRIGLESTIIDMTQHDPVLLRAGGMSLESIEETIGPVHPIIDDTIKAPGQLKRHYAPTKPMRLHVTKPLDHEGYLTFGPYGLQRQAPTLNLSESGDVNEAAYHLFSMLRELDEGPAPAIAVHPIPLKGLGLAINDRLIRGASS